tara:strand:+ start:670 stop:819 length:150 start_codon:yes stop_codon:yes gene_type:complete
MLVAIIGIIHNLWKISRILKDLDRRIYYIESISAEELIKMLGLEDKDES